MGRGSGIYESIPTQAPGQKVLGLIQEPFRVDQFENRPRFVLSQGQGAKLLCAAVGINRYREGVIRQIQVC